MANTRVAASALGWNHAAAMSEMSDIPVRIAIKDIPQSEAIEAKIREKAHKLSRYSDRLTGCDVTVDSPERRHHKGKLYNVHIRMHVPGEELIVSREPNEDPYVAIRDAFEAATRQLDAYTSRRRGR